VQCFRFTVIVCWSHLLYNSKHWWWGAGLVSICTLNSHFESGKPLFSVGTLTIRMGPLLSGRYCIITFVWSKWTCFFNLTVSAFETRLVECYAQFSWLDMTVLLPEIRHSFHATWVLLPKGGDSDLYCLAWWWRYARIWIVILDRFALCWHDSGCRRLLARRMFLFLMSIDNAPRGWRASSLVQIVQVGDPVIPAISTSRPH